MSQFIKCGRGQRANVPVKATQTGKDMPEKQYTQTGPKYTGPNYKQPDPAVTKNSDII